MYSIESKQIETTSTIPNKKIYTLIYTKLFYYFIYFFIQDKNILNVLLITFFRARPLLIHGSPREKKLCKTFLAQLYTTTSWCKLWKKFAFTGVSIMTCRCKRCLVKLLKKCANLISHNINKMEIQYFTTSSKRIV